MGESEEYFPRGGKKPSVTYFKPSANFLGAAEKGEKKKQKLKKKSDGDDGYLSGEVVADQDMSTKNCGIFLNYKIVKEGQILLGRVWQAWETKVNISLPCKLLGSVMACHISEPYNKVLEAYVNDQREEVYALNKMFRPGQYVAVRILEIKHRKLTLSMMPQHVNGGRSKSELHKGTILQAAVVSAEDHGYVMDIGIPNTRAFLPKAAANSEVQLDPGSLTWCCIKSLESDNSVVTLSNQLGALRTAVERQSTTTLLPGTALEFTVDKSLENGIEGHIFKDTKAYVQRHQVDKIKGNKPKLGQKIRARVLYVLPTKLTPFLTMKNIFESTYPNLEAEQKFKDGDIIEDAQVIKIIKRSVIFKLGEGSVGMLSIRRIQVDEDLTDEDVIAKSYPIGSKHKVRVLFYNLSDYTYSLSDEAKVLEERYFSFADISVGDIVTATVTNVQGHRLQLSVGRLSGQVPQTHMSDSGLYVHPKKATTSMLSKKYKVGQEVKARVLSLDREKAMLVLTLKPTLLAPEFEVLHSYEDAKIGKVYKGVIVQVRDYVLVGFFNSVMAWVPKNRVAYPPPKDDVPLPQLFHPGQIVNCTIIRVDPTKRKMAGSLITRAFDPNISKAKAAKRRQESLKSSVPQKKNKGTDSDKSKKKENKNIKAKKNPPVVTEDIKMEESDEEISEESDTDAVEIKPEENGKGLREANEDVSNASETDDELTDKTVKKIEKKVKPKKNFLEAVTLNRSRKKKFLAKLISRKRTKKIKHQ